MILINEYRLNIFMTDSVSSPPVIALVSVAGPSHGIPPVHLHESVLIVLVRVCFPPFVFQLDHPDHSQFSGSVYNNDITY